MEIFELQEKLQDSIAKDLEVNNFCSKNYNKMPLVFLGVDEKNPPSKDDYPVIVIFHVDRAERGENEQFVTYEVEIGVGIIDDSIEKIENKVTFRGTKKVEELRSLVELAVFRARIGHKLDVNGKTASDMIFPLFRSDTIIRVQFVKSQRGPI